MLTRQHSSRMRAARLPAIRSPVTHPPHPPATPLSPSHTRTPREQTDTCKNITFQQLCLRAVKISTSCLTEHLYLTKRTLVVGLRAFCTLDGSVISTKDVCMLNLLATFRKYLFVPEIKQDPHIDRY